MMVGVVRILLLQETAVTQQHGIEPGSRVRAIDLAREPVPRQRREVAGMVDVSVRQQYCVGALWRDREGRPVSETQVLEALEQVTVDQDATRPALKQEF